MKIEGNNYTFNISTNPDKALSSAEEFCNNHKETFNLNDENIKLCIEPIERQLKSAIEYHEKNNKSNSVKICLQLKSLN